jgi:hypothetical protein
VAFLKKKLRQILQLADYCDMSSINSSSESGPFIMRGTHAGQHAIQGHIYTIHK